MATSAPSLRLLGLARQCIKLEDAGGFNHGEPVRLFQCCGPAPGPLHTLTYLLVEMCDCVSVSLLVVAHYLYSVFLWAFIQMCVRPL